MPESENEFVEEDKVEGALPTLHPDLAKYLKELGKQTFGDEMRDVIVKDYQMQEIARSLDERLYG